VPAIAPLEATLALGVRARRRVQQLLRHLLPSAPLTGASVRRLTRLSGVSSAGTPLRWRAAHGWQGRAGGEARRVASQPASAKPHALQTPAATPSVARSATTAAVPPATIQVLRSDVAYRTPELGPLLEREPSATAQEPRSFGSAPTLVWFARWHEVRQTRVVQERRAALVTPGMPWSARVAGMSAPAVGSATSPSVAAQRSATLSAPSIMPAGTVALPLSPSKITPTSPAGPPRSTNVSGADAVSATASGSAASIASPGFALTEMPATPYWASLAAVIRGPLRARAARSIDGETPASAVTARPVFRYGGAEPRVAHASEPVPDLVTSTGPAAAAAVYAVDAVKRVLPDRIATQVQQDLARAIERVQPRAQPSPAPLPDVPRIDDRMVSALLGRMRAMLREQQFRHGHLR
jgi:hypothetical protein